MTMSVCDTLSYQRYINEPNDITVLRWVLERDIPFFSKSLERLTISYLGNINIPPFPESLKYLYIFNVDMKSLPLTVLNNGLLVNSFPPRMLECKIAFTSIENIPSLPDSLISLELSYTNISIIPPLPEGLKVLKINRGYLTSLPPIPKSTQVQINNLSYLYAPEIGSKYMVNRLPIIKKSQKSLLYKIRCRKKKELLSILEGSKIELFLSSFFPCFIWKVCEYRV